MGAPGLTSRHFLHPALDTFVRAWPHTYRDVKAPDGTRLTLAITGEAGDDWTLARQAGAWRLYQGRADDAAATIQMDQDTAWRLFTKGMSAAQARTRTRIDGDEALGEHVLGILAIMA